ncbi:uncharacterized protein LOC122870256 [Siniperca chuatsi]|uniref:uncharacterized protein LOC122870256 n=1 Tax=Siniperca chuatsi TaxID=119488 RepID=UPI001CE0C802|nr:uncharacterized protein LOC122870256 [Siniperca chuatsi]
MKTFPLLILSLMTVSPTVSARSSTDPVSSTQSTAASTESRVSTTSSTSPVSSNPIAAAYRSFPVLVTVIICVAVLLLFVLIFILIYKRLIHSKNTRNGAAAQYIKEDYVYEEIQQHVQKPDSGNAMNTIYATANFPTNPSDSLHYSSINFQSSSGRAGGEALILKPSSAACEYSTVKYRILSTQQSTSQSRNEERSALSGINEMY